MFLTFLYYITPKLKKFIATCLCGYSLDKTRMSDAVPKESVPTDQTIPATEESVPAEAIPAVAEEAKTTVTAEAKTSEVGETPSKSEKKE